MEHSSLGDRRLSGSPSDSSRAPGEHERHRDRKTHRKTRSIGDSLAWIFRTNLPPRRGTPLQSVQKRSCFGFGEVLSVLVSPNGTLEQLTEARKALEKTQRELRLRTGSFASCLPPQAFSVSFLPLSNADLLPRPSESSALHRLFDGPPIFTVLCGPPSVGKTTLLREVLRDEKYYVLYFDMRVIRGVGLEGLFGGLCAAVEWFAQSMLKDLREGGKENEELEKAVRAVKHDSQVLCHRLEKSHTDPSVQSVGVMTCDVARLIQLFRTAFLLSWQLQPLPKALAQPIQHKQQSTEDAGDITTSEETKVGPVHTSDQKGGHGKEKSTETVHWDEKIAGPSGAVNEKEASKEGEQEDREEKKAVKRIPVIVFDDAQKLPSLANSPSSLQALHYLIEALLVLSRQDRLCHVVHTSNDGLYVNWLRELGVLEGCKIITLTDPPKPQIRTYLSQTLLPSFLSLPPLLRCRLESEETYGKLYEAFGGRLTHWADFARDWVNVGGDLSVERSNPFLQAYTLLNVLLLRASEAEEQSDLGEQETAHEHDPQDRDHARCRSRSRTRLGDRCRSRSSLRIPHQRRAMKSSATLLGLTTEETYVEKGEEEKPPLTTMQLLDILYRLTSPTYSAGSMFSPTIRPVSMKSIKVIERTNVGGGVKGIPYFALCRELCSMSAVDFLVRSGIAELRWGSILQAPSSELAPRSYVDDLRRHGKERETVDQEEEMERVEGDVLEVGAYGPTLHPASPILAYAMRVVLDEYGYQPAQEVEEDIADDDVVGGRGRAGVVHDDLFYGHGGHSNGGHNGRESSGLSDGQSDYMSFRDDVSEY